MKKGIFIGFVAGVITTILAIFLVCLVSFFLENAWFFYDVEPIPAPDMPIIYPDGTVELFNREGRMYCIVHPDGSKEYIRRKNPSVFSA